MRMAYRHAAERTATTSMESQYTAGMRSSGSEGRKMYVTASAASRMRSCRRFDRYSGMAGIRICVLMDWAKLTSARMAAVSTTRSWTGSGQKNAANRITAAMSRTWLTVPICENAPTTGEQRRYSAAAMPSVPRIRRSVRPGRARPPALRPSVSSASSSGIR